MTEQKGTANPLPLLNRYRLEMFHAHCALIDQLFLRHWSQQISQQISENTAGQSKQSNWNCIIVDDRPTQQARICILNTLLMTGGKAAISVYTTAQQQQAFEELLQPWLGWITIQTINDPNINDTLGWSGYNNLFKSSTFWQSLQGEQILVFQPDALIIQPLELSDLCFGYAGAPWNKGRITSCEFPLYNKQGTWINNQWLNQSLCQSTPSEINNGNGGLSIRSRRLMQKICADHAHSSPAEEAEDIFFARHIASGGYQANLPSQARLRQLFNETNAADCLGFHGSWFYLSASEQAKIYETHAKHVIGLLTALP